MAALEHKIDFLALVSVTKANGNGDPLNGNRPRVDYNGIGEISDVCIKRKIRNRMQDMGYAIFVQSDDRCSDGFKSLSERAAAATKGIKDRDTYAQTACKKMAGCIFFRERARFYSCTSSCRFPVSPGCMADLIADSIWTDNHIRRNCP